MPTSPARPHLSRLTWLNAKRIARGWRWRSLVLISGASAYWFTRMVDFGEGSAVWFPGGENGVNGFTLFFALAAAVMGVDVIAQWDRARARQLLHSHLIQPSAYLLANLLAVAIMGLVPAAVAAFWTPIGAWRAGSFVLWTPNLLYLILVALPVLTCAAACGLLGRVLFRSDLAALAVAMLFLTPMLAFRLLSAPAAELFQLSSGSFGILIPTATLLREAFLCLACALLPLGLAATGLPAPRPSSVSVGRRGWLRLDSPILLAASARMALQYRQWSGATILVALTSLSVGLLATAELVRLRPVRVPPVVWGTAREPQGIVRGEIPPLAILRREIVLPSRPGDPLNVTLHLAALDGTASVGALNFGPSLILDSIQGEDGLVVSETPEQLSEGSPTRLLRFQPPLSSDRPSVLKFRLRPAAAAKRLWEQAYHPAYHRFSALGTWYGESALISYRLGGMTPTSQDSPFTIDAPEASPLEWLAGGARTGPSAPGRIEITQPLADSPARLIAARLMTVPPTGPDSLPLTFLIQPRRRLLAANLHRIYALPLSRLYRVFGPPAEDLVLYEIPENAPSDPLALPSSMLDRLDSLLPRYDDYERPTRNEFFVAFSRPHEGLVHTLWSKSFSSFEQPALLREGLITYVDNYGLAKGQSRQFVPDRRIDAVFLPWSARIDVHRDFDIRPADAQAWAGPLLASRRAPRDPPAASLRNIAFHHMLRGLLGDDAFLRAIRRLSRDHRGETLTIALYRTVLEAEHGENLEWFFDQWLGDGVVPDYQIVEAQAVLMEDPTTRALQYLSRIVIRNKGTGRMPVPWLLVTEGESIEDKRWLDAGETAELSIRSIDRPVAFEIDPQGWVAQLNRNGKSEGFAHPRVLFKTIKEM